MMNSNQYEELSPKALHDRIGEGRELFLIDTTLDEHFQRCRLPNAANACVFKVIFMDRVRAVTENKDSEIVLYGIGNQSMDVDVAAEKLAREGYKHVSVLKGGIEAWRSAGLPLEGEAVDDPGDPQAVLTPTDGTWRVDADRSMIEWRGRNSGTTHVGTIRIASGELAAKAGTVTGKFNIAMDSITNINLEGDPLQPILVDHLRSDDFFFTHLFPSATFEIVAARLVDEPFLTCPNLEIFGMLELRGVKAPLDFMATISEMSEKGLTAEAHFDIDRTKWGVVYGSTRFFKYLGMHRVFDFISLQVRIVADGSA